MFNITNSNQFIHTQKWTTYIIPQVLLAFSCGILHSPICLISQTSYIFVLTIIYSKFLPYPCLTLNSACANSTPLWALRYTHSLSNMCIYIFLKKGLIKKPLQSTYYYHKQITHVPRYMTFITNGVLYIY